jgi:hypothetical protein
MERLAPRPVGALLLATMTMPGVLPIADAAIELLAEFMSREGIG